MLDPWTERSLFPGTRFVCPFDDWWHDERDDGRGEEIPMDVLDGATTLEEMLHARTTAFLTAKYRRIDGVIRAHLETHTLEQWAAAAAALHQIRRSVSVVAEVPEPAPGRIHDALCAGSLTVDDARWIQHARVVMEAVGA